MNPDSLDAEGPSSLSRRVLLGVAAATALTTPGLSAGDKESGAVGASAVALTAAQLAEITRKLAFLTPMDRFGGFVREKPAPYNLPDEQQREFGLHRETWRLEVLPEGEAKVANPLSREKGTALSFPGLMKLAETRVVRFMKTLTCTNGAERFGTGIWEGVPLRDVVWMAQPKERIRRVYYYGFHNDDPKQKFDASLTLARVLEDPPGELPVILCYKYNGHWLSGKMGGPVRMIVPEAYGNKSVKWVQRIVLSSIFQANDTYANWSNDTETPVKTCARFINPPKKLNAGEPMTLQGYATAGMSGLSKVQWACCPQDMPLPADDPHLAHLDWHDAVILQPPARSDGWGGEIEGNTLPPIPLQFDPATGAPRCWPLRYTAAYWAAGIRIATPGQYHLRCRTIDANGVAQPMPRPMARSGVNVIQKVEVEVA